MREKRIGTTEANDTEKLNVTRDFTLLGIENRSKREGAADHKAFSHYCVMEKLRVAA